MKDATLSGLFWLPPAPEDFFEQCEVLERSPGPLGRRLRALASTALDENRLNRLAKVVAALHAAPGALDPLTPFRLGISSNATTHFLVPALIATAARYGFALECIEGGFDQTLQDASDPGSPINRARPDAVLVALDHHGLHLRAEPGDEPSEEASVIGAIAHIDAIRRGFSGNCGAACIVQTLARPVEPWFGSFDAVLPGTPRRLVDGFNRRLAERIRGSADLLLDAAAVAESVGLAEWHDPTLWNIGKVAFSSTYLALYAEAVCRLVAAFRGRSRRCLVLDLDNTLWGGVIGDDGLSDIVLGQGDPTGEAFLQVQRAALALRQRGIALAVCSKNEDEIARAPFRNHPEMLLREDHFAAFRANWEDKASNLRAIAGALSLGLESLVFLDDNPVERGLVRELLPEVAVPELPDDPALYARTLLSAGYFEAIAFSAEDRGRADAYRDNTHREALRESASSIEDYLRSLKTVVDFRPFDPVGRGRIAQLIAKSNQFNLTTRRYSEAEVARMEGDPSRFTLQVRVADVFGDSGMVCVVICVREGDDWRIDTWLMSCRVLGRMVEEAVLGELVRHAREGGVRRLLGTYLPTDRNQLVEDHYGRLGFALLERNESGASHWALAVDKYTPRELPLSVSRSRDLASQPSAPGSAR
ncbi:MAG TPA: HAD-IIIC family phosphatase [Burkholderiales bacterium]|nr:HAD-IIIC family phosphatase [Burkholderiales bacterium]